VQEFHCHANPIRELGRLNISPRTGQKRLLAGLPLG
jgi:hypothetical protein